MIGKISEIDDLKSRGRLESLQGFVLDTDAQQEVLDASLDRRKGHIEAGDMLGRQLHERINIVQKRIDNEEVDPNIAKLLIAEIQGCVDHVRQFASSSQNELILIRGKKMGLEQAAAIAKNRFDAEVANYERHKAMESDMEEDRALRRKTSAKKAAPKKSRAKRKK